MPKKDIKLSAEQELENLIQKLEDEYLFPYDYDLPNANSSEEMSLNDSRLDEKQTSKHEIKRVKNFLKTPCKCGLSCQKLFQLDEVLNARKNFNLLSWKEKGCFLLPLLESFRVNIGCSKSARTTTQRKRQKYIYRINSNREVCREAFLFYYDIPLRKLKYFQHHLLEVGIIPPEHGNIRKTPYNAYSEAEKNKIKLFLNNFATTQADYRTLAEI